MTYINEYWDSIFKSNVVFNNKVLSISINNDLELMILSQKNKTYVTIKENIYNRLDLSSDIKTEYFYSQLNDLDIKLYSADNLFYLSDKAADKISSKDYINTRLLNIDDVKLLNDFESKINDKELDEAYVKLDHYLALGYIVNNQLLAAASVYIYRDSKIMDIGIVSDPNYRGKGIAKATVQALSKEVISRKYFIQYRCSDANMASYYLALSCGFELYGKLEVIKSK